jgi:hypothetical protein
MTRTSGRTEPTLANRVAMGPWFPRRAATNELDYAFQDSIGKRPGKAIKRVLIKLG